MMYRPEQGCSLCRPVLEALAAETHEDYTRRKVREEGLVDYEGFCTLIDQADEALGHLLRQRPSGDLLALALHLTEEPEP